jgi:hypothetical protein
MLARERTITPEPPPAVQSKSGYKFTPAEMTYAWALVRRILTKDPLANKLTVVRVLQKKVCRVQTPFVDYALFISLVEDASSH